MIYGAGAIGAPATGPECTIGNEVGAIGPEEIGAWKAGPGAYDTGWAAKAGAAAYAPYIGAAAAGRGAAA